ncbi:hypothetical protein SEA_ZOOMAN_351 [Microbacterium phage Zooman]|nr:hypothetical protein SEA_ZOOMAN_38 [Microbacterium phage Zooman]UDL16592.1 hypothetical protein SEA_ZOOMAN_351 [Microbacterium phage Zooman]
MTTSDIAGESHIDTCIALTPETCEGTCFDERIEEIRYELTEIEHQLTSPEYDLTIETETRLQRSQDELEQELRRLNI